MNNQKAHPSIIERYFTKGKYNPVASERRKIEVQQEIKSKTYGRKSSNRLFDSILPLNTFIW